MSSPLDSTMGIWLVSLFLATILYGMGLIQAFLYFNWYTKDHWGVKAVVICLVILETLHITFFFCGTYWILIDHFGDFAALVVITWYDSAQLLAGYLSAFTVQMYFAYCIYALSPKYKIMPMFIAALALLQIGAGLAQTIITTELGSFTLLDKTKRITTLQAASAFACDVSITACLCYTLNGKRTGLKSTNSLLNTLMIIAVNRGMLTALSAALNIILFLSIPNTFWFFLGLILSGKLYMNSMLATLNTRQHIRGRLNEDSAGPWNSIHIRNLSSNRNTNSGGTNVPEESTLNSHIDPAYEDKGNKTTFTMDMV
ncbi:hypothetical protein DFH07DRAFT_439326 [Mycena maculata]|uniref:DUF6534 domain-containing protein n=1 Tax=Mycena maculata TaxID=230809 RepID=A0AAD7KAW0_9AGAR|nr:hypothetical protein DFH07DRAFT_439326 [Mycena maculata]